jgi:hypothetical protein
MGVQQSTEGRQLPFQRLYAPLQFDQLLISRDAHQYGVQLNCTVSPDVDVPVTVAL